jgi:1-phosphatidylinositol-4-phosphate 5-kinase
MARRSTVHTEAPAIGNAINPETKSYDRIYGMLLGIRIHVSRISAHPPVAITQDHFNEYEKLKIPREGNHYAPAHRGRYDYKFKTYAPIAFLHLRHFFGITDEEYLISLTADYMMSELATIGRSSAMFYYTWDGRYMLKTLTKGELKVLLRMLPGYYDYVRYHPNTFVNHFFGAYRSATGAGRSIRFAIMNNVFPIGFQIHYKFDLKGSTVNRSVGEDKRARPGSTWKDSEFELERYLKIGPRDWLPLDAQFVEDTNFLSKSQVMDYSLLVGVHQFNPDSPILHPAMGEKIEIFTVFTPDRSSESRYKDNSVIVKKVHLKKGRKTVKRRDPTVRSQLKFERSNFSAVMPWNDGGSGLRSFCGGLRGTNDRDEPLSEIYFLGIIDFLQEYSIAKKTEHVFKRIVWEKDTMSCVNPSVYASRMLAFLRKTIGPRDIETPEQRQEAIQRIARLEEMSRPIQHRRPSVRGIPGLDVVQPSPLARPGEEAQEQEGTGS